MKRFQFFISVLLIAVPGALAPASVFAQDCKDVYPAGVCGSEGNCNSQNRLIVGQANELGCTDGKVCCIPRTCEANAGRCRLGEPATCIEKGETYFSSGNSDCDPASVCCIPPKSSSPSTPGTITLDCEKEGGSCKGTCNSTTEWDRGKAALECEQTEHCCVPLNSLKSCVNDFQGRCNIACADPSKPAVAGDTDCSPSNQSCCAPPQASTPGGATPSADGPAEPSEGEEEEEVAAVPRTKRGLINPLGPRSVPELIGTIVAWLGGLAGSAFLIFLLWGGVQYMVAGGDPQRVEKAKKKILYSVLGIVIIFLAFFLVDALIGLTNVPLTSPVPGTAGGLSQPTQTP